MHEQGTCSRHHAYERAVELRPNLFHALRAAARPVTSRKGFRRKAVEAVETGGARRADPKNPRHHCGSACSSCSDHGPRAGVTPSIRNFAHAIDRQRQALERIPLLDVTRPDLVEAARALDEAEAAALALATGVDLAPLAAVARAVSIRCCAPTSWPRSFASTSRGAPAPTPCCCARPRFPPELLARLVQAATSTHMAACVACANAAEIAQAGAAQRRWSCSITLTCICRSRRAPCARAFVLPRSARTRGCRAGSGPDRCGLVRRALDEEDR